MMRNQCQSIKYIYTFHERPVVALWSKSVRPRGRSIAERMFFMSLAFSENFSYPYFKLYLILLKSFKDTLRKSKINK